MKGQNSEHSYFNKYSGAVKHIGRLSSRIDRQQNPANPSHKKGLTYIFPLKRAQLNRCVRDNSPLSKGV